MLLISRGVVCATGGGQAISPRSPRLLVVAGQRLSEVPVSYKSAETFEYTKVGEKKKKKKTRYKKNASDNCAFAASPDIGLIYSHAKADGSHNNQHFPLHPLILYPCPICCLQAYKSRAQTLNFTHPIHRSGITS